MSGPPERYFIATLGCPKNQVDSDKLEGTFVAAGMEAAADAASADVVVVNTCAFIEAARQESIEAVLAAADHRKDGARVGGPRRIAEPEGGEVGAAAPAGG